MGHRKSSTSTTTTSGSSGGGSMDGGGGGGMGSACYVYDIDPNAIPALDPNPDVQFQMGVDMNIPLSLDDGNTVTMWGFVDQGGNMGGGGMGGGTFPSPAMRVRQGDIVQTTLQVGMMMYHTIHHHGIEPEYRSDGVGHISWDVNGTYTYQWRPAQAGTYFYHCHTNTVLHAEMGMYGAIIVDPPGGPGTAFQGGPSYDVEAVWAVDEIDSSWHTLPWTAGTCGGDVGLNDLNPDYFVITGVDGAQSALTDPAVAVTMNRGQRLLVRYICAGYLPQQIRFGGLTAQVVASDGRPLPNPVSVSHIDAVSAERYDCIIQPGSRGTYTVEIDIKHWVTGQVLGTARTRITVL
jgi:FtsP/CotA-like multicopper oxidase with cupredoxin domain